MSDRGFVSWSGGKDGCLALYRAVSNGRDVRYLANMVTNDGKRSCSHGISAAVIKRQAEALGIPIVQRRTTGDNYTQVFTNTLRSSRAERIESGVFGDIDFEPHREWIERVCGAAGITPHLPLWGEDQSALMEEFINAGFVSVVVAVRADLLGPEALGRTVDRDFMAYLEGLGKGITPCGESGEFHTLVVDGPLFRKRLEMVESRVETRGDHHFLEILRTDLVEKQSVERA